MESDKIKEPVRIRFKKLKNGNSSIYLDIYVNGERSYEFLKLYLIKENSKEDKQRNKETLRRANAKKAQRIIEIQKGTYGEDKRDDVYFFDYFKAICEKKNSKSWETTFACIKEYEKNERITLKSIDRKWADGFANFLINKKNKKKNSEIISANSANLYYTKFKAAMNIALRDGIILSNPVVSSVKKKETERNFLTIEELKMLSCSDFSRNESLKKMFLFSCLTGLRLSDIKKLKWGDVQKNGEYTRIVFRQKKTGSQEYLDINEQASSLLNEKGEDNEFVFSNYSQFNINNYIRRWMKDVGINKNITFHCARHTFATMMLEIGTDIYTVSKLLGHKEISTTQIYAKVIDKSKQEAIKKIPKIL